MTQKHESVEDLIDLLESELYAMMDSFRDEYPYEVSINSVSDYSKNGISEHSVLIKIQFE